MSNGQEKNSTWFACSDDHGKLAMYVEERTGVGVCNSFVRLVAATQGASRREGING